MAIEPVVPVWTKFVNNGMKDPKFISAVNSVNLREKKIANSNVSNQSNNNEILISEKKNQLSIQNCSPEKMKKTDQSAKIGDLERCITEVKDFFTDLWPFSDSKTKKTKNVELGDLSRISEASDMEPSSFSFAFFDSNSDYDVSSSRQEDFKSNDACPMVHDSHSFLKNKPVCSDININNSYDNILQEKQRNYNKDSKTIREKKFNFKDKANKYAADDRSKSFCDAEKNFLYY